MENVLSSRSRRNHHPKECPVPPSIIVETKQPIRTSNTNSSSTTAGRIMQRLSFRHRRDRNTDEHNDNSSKGQASYMDEFDEVSDELTHDCNALAETTSLVSESTDEIDRESPGLSNKIVSKTNSRGVVLRAVHSPSKKDDVRIIKVPLPPDCTENTTDLSCSSGLHLESSIGSSRTAKVVRAPSSVVKIVEHDDCTDQQDQLDDEAEVSEYNDDTTGDYDEEYDDEDEDEDSRRRNNLYRTTSEDLGMMKFIRSEMLELAASTDAASTIRDVRLLSEQRLRQEQQVEQSKLKALLEEKGNGSIRSSIPRRLYPSENSIKRIVMTPDDDEDDQNQNNKNNNSQKVNHNDNHNDNHNCSHNGLDETKHDREKKGLKITNSVSQFKQMRQKDGMLEEAKEEFEDDFEQEVIERKEKESKRENSNSHNIARGYGSNKQNSLYPKTDDVDDLIPMIEVDMVFNTTQSEVGNNNQGVEEVAAVNADVHVGTGSTEQENNHEDCLVRPSYGGYDVAYEKLQEEERREARRTGRSTDETTEDDLLAVVIAAEITQEEDDRLLAQKHLEDEDYEQALRQQLENDEQASKNKTRNYGSSLSRLAEFERTTVLVQGPSNSSVILQPTSPNDQRNPLSVNTNIHSASTNLSNLAALESRFRNSIGTPYAVAPVSFSVSSGNVGISRQEQHHPIMFTRQSSLESLISTSNSIEPIMGSARGAGGGVNQANGSSYRWHNNVASNPSFVDDQAFNYTSAGLSLNQPPNNSSSSYSPPLRNVNCGEMSSSGSGSFYQMSTNNFNGSLSYDTQNQRQSASSHQPNNGGNWMSTPEQQALQQQPFFPQTPVQQQHQYPTQSQFNYHPSSRSLNSTTHSSMLAEQMMMRNRNVTPAGHGNLGSNSFHHQQTNGMGFIPQPQNNNPSHAFQHNQLQQIPMHQMSPPSPTSGYFSPPDRGLRQTISTHSYNNNVNTNGTYNQGTGFFDVHESSSGMNQFPQRRSPHQVESSATHTHGGCNENISSNTSRTIEISPGVNERLRGAQETSEAINRGSIIFPSCMACTTSLICIADADYVLCPVCRTISPTAAMTGGRQSQSGGVGLGLRAEQYQG